MNGAEHQVINIAPGGREEIALSVHELKPGGGRVAAADPVWSSLQQWAQNKPLEIALRHKQRGRWLAWRWIDVLREVERLGAGLQAQGFGPDSRLALSGAFAPALLFFALAARRAGASVLAVAPQEEAAGLRSLLERQRPSHAYVASRESLAVWLAVGRQSASQWPLMLYARQAVALDASPWRVEPLQALYGDRAESPRAAHGLRSPRQLWSEEGSEWQPGLQLLLERWLLSGDSLALPEHARAASRDRRAIAPSHLLLSEQRLERLAEEIEAHLAPVGSWRRRLCDWAIAAPERGLRRLLKQRVRHLLGFRHLQGIERGDGRQGQRLAWLETPRSDAA
ncbi:acyl-CoA synthetase [Stutzerimonas kirkiae]|uniref:Acyl-CoA synthetase n=1 Tax=Stutzerimonas kirkiae TaxID=2211392 RepID=A0A4Q9RC87_9GAMM|nr:AMP-binding protein [Stutzerimonas kirkiae]TBU98613.1 acyl-CoA synthetase [Stutzerimonas kirkiae]TBV04214.1 acyl-CoA synthetase [Stutzerimonas kirkiae]